MLNYFFATTSEYEKTQRKIHEKLFKAIEFQDTAQIKEMLKDVLIEGSDLYTYNLNYQLNGLTPLMAAYIYAKEANPLDNDIVKVLLQSSRVNKNTIIGDRIFKTGLFFPLDQLGVEIFSSAQEQRSNHSSVFSMVLNTEPDLIQLIKDRNLSEFRKVILTKPYLINKVINKRHPLSMAINNADGTIEKDPFVSLILEMPFLDVKLMSEICLPAVFNYNCENYDGIKLLLERGADPKDSECKELYLHDCINADNFKLFELFIQYNANVNIEDCNGITPILHSIIESKHQFTKLLFKNAADLSMSGHSLNSTIEILENKIKGGDTELLELYEDYKSKIKSKDAEYFGVKPLPILTLKEYCVIAYRKALQSTAYKDKQFIVPELLRQLLTPLKRDIIDTVPLTRLNKLNNQAKQYDRMINTIYRLENSLNIKEESTIEEPCDDKQGRKKRRRLV